MISHLRGTLQEKDPPWLVVEVHGIGYDVEAPLSTFHVLPQVGTEVMIYTHLIIREDAHVLCGFASARERELFRSLIKVNGVGSKLALAILSGMSIDEFIHSVQDKDVVSLTRLPGVGKKTAERLLVELHDRLAQWQTSEARPITLQQDAAGQGRVAYEAMSALLALGYKQHEVSRLLQQINMEGRSSEAIIKDALKLALR